MGQRTRLARCAGACLRATVAGSCRRGAALRPGDLRRHQGVSPRRRLHLDLPAPRQRRAPAALRGAAGVAAIAGRRVRGVAAPAGGDRPRMGAVGTGNEPVLSSLHDRHRGLPRRARGAGRGLPRHRQPGRARTSPTAFRRCRSGCRRTTRARPRAAPARPSAAGTTPRRCCRSWKRARTGVRRCCSSIRSRGSTWKNSVA
jgi:hypothetical protein